MTEIGTAFLRIVPSLDGISDSINRQLGGKLRVAGKQGGKELAKGVGDGLKDLEKAVESAANSYGKLKDKASDALGKVRADEAALKKLRDSGAGDDRIVKAEERLAKSRRDSTRASRDAEGGHRSLLKAQKDLADGTDNLGGKFAGLGSAMSSFGVIAAGAATAGIAALAVGIVAAGKALYDLGGQFDDISDSFVIKLGATGDKLAALNKQVTDLGPTLALPLGDIGGIVADVNRHLEGSRGELENVTQAVGDLNRMTGTSTDIHKFGQLLAQWKVPAQDQVKTLDLLFNASRKTGASVNDLMETLTGKGAVALRELNIPLDEAAGLMLKFQEAGLDAGGSVDALAKAQKAAAKDGKDLNTVLSDTFNAIKNAPTQGLADQAGFAVFGKAAGPITEAIRNGTLTLKDFYAVMEAGGPTIAETAALTDDFAQKWQKLKNRLEVAIKPVATAMFDTINAKLSQVSDWAIHHQDDVIRVIGAIGSALIKVGQDAIGFAQGVLRAFKGIIEGYNDLPGWLRGEQIDTSFIDKTITGLDGVKDKLSGAQDWWTGFTDRAAEAVKLTQSLGDTVRAWVDEGDHQIHISSTSPEVEAELTKLGLHVQHLPDGKLIVTANTEEGRRIIDAWRAQEQGDPITPPVQPDLTGANATMAKFIDTWTKAIIAPQVQVPGQAAPGQNPLTAPYRAGGGGFGGGGGVRGPGTATSDSIPAWLSNGEHVLSASDVAKMGGQSGVYAFRNALHRAGGGWVTAYVDPELERQWPTGPGSVSGEERKPNGDQTPIYTGDPGLRWGDIFKPGRRLGDKSPIPWWGKGGSNSAPHDRWVRKGIFGDTPGDFGDTPASGSPAPMTPGGPGRDVMKPGTPWDPKDFWQTMGYGASGTDRIPAWLSDGEHVLTADDVAAMGGQRAVLDFRHMLHRADGGPVTDDQLTAFAQAHSGGRYSWGASDLVKGLSDCSGAVSDLVEVLTKGQSDPGRLFSTANAGQVLSQLGAVQGAVPGALQIGWVNGGPGGGHMRATLPNGMPFESGGGTGQGATYGGPAQGAAGMPNIMSLRVRKAGEQDGTTLTRAYYDGLSDGGQTALDEQGAKTSGSGFSLPSTISGLAGFGLDSLGAGVGTTSSGSDLSLFGKAAGSAVSGQVSSALSVLGVGDSPGWLQGISKFVSGISVSGPGGQKIFDGGSFNFGAAAPLAATPTVIGAAAAPDGTVHGGQAGAAPGPTYNIRTATVEDAFVRAQRIEKEKAAAKLSAY